MAGEGSDPLCLLGHMFSRTAAVQGIGWGLLSPHPTPTRPEEFEQWGSEVCSSQNTYLRDIGFHSVRPPPPRVRKLWVNKHVRIFIDYLLNPAFQDLNKNHLSLLLCFHPPPLSRDFFPPL